MLRLSLLRLLDYTDKHIRYSVRYKNIITFLLTEKVDIKTCFHNEIQSFGVFFYNENSDIQIKIWVHKSEKYIRE